MKTLALNMMVGPGESELLTRCLESCEAEKFFDEVVIVCTSQDEKVLAVAGRYGTVVKRDFFSPENPHGDFAACRNAALVNTVSDYVMWLDADDIVDEACQAVMYKIRKIINAYDVDYYNVKYKLHDGQEFIRDRIFKRSSATWKYPVHEQLQFRPDAKFAKLDAFWITHRPMKAAEVSNQRNRAILAHAMASNPQDNLIRYFMAKELFTQARIEPTEISLAIELAEDYILQHRGNIDNTVNMCLELAQMAMKDKQYLYAEINLRIALSLSDKYAECFVLLGDCYAAKNQTDDAAKLYKQALSIGKMDAGNVQHAAYYSILPMKRLVSLYESKGDLELALYWNKKLMKTNPTQEVCGMRERLLEKFSEQEGL